MHRSIALYSPQTATVDALRSGEASVGLQLLAIVGFAALTALGAQVRLYLWEVPFTLQTVAVYGSGLFLGWRNGVLAQVLYLLAGLVLPIYAGGGMGMAYLYTAASAGYLLAFPVVAALVGVLSTRWNALSGSVLSLLVASVLLFTIGVIWLHYAAGHGNWWTSLDRGWLRFIPADLAKIFFTALVYTGARRI